MVFVEDISLGKKYFQRVKNNVAEVYAVEFQQPFLIFLIDVGEDGFFVIVLNLVSAQPLVFPAADLIKNRLWRVLFVINAFRFENLFNQAFLVVFVENGKIAFQSDDFGMVAQNFDADAVKGAKPDRICHISNQPLNPFAHFSGCPVGKSDDQAIPRIGFVLRQDIGEPGGQHFGFAGTGAGEDQDRPFGGFDSFFLFGIQHLQPAVRGGQLRNVVKGVRSAAVSFGGKVKYIIHG